MAKDREEEWGGGLWEGTMGRTERFVSRSSRRMRDIRETGRGEEIHGRHIQQDAAILSP